MHAMKRIVCLLPALLLAGGCARQAESDGYGGSLAQESAPMAPKHFQGASTIQGRQSRVELSSWNEQLPLEVTVLVLLPGRVEAHETERKSPFDLYLQAKITRKMGKMQLSPLLKIGEEPAPRK